jgi:Mlc titration factor MtfA (ptsG expression regulator)
VSLLGSKWFERLRIRHTLRRHPIPSQPWGKLMCEAGIFHGLSAVDRAHLRELTTLFLHRKAINGVQGLTVSTEMALVVAAQACLPILKLGLGYYDGWVEVVIYPGAFRVVRDHIDATGLVSHEERSLSGETWSRGPVILSWDDVAADLAVSRRGHNVVVHEFAHKLDMLNGRANGMPPLHADMVRKQWTAVFSDAFDHLYQRLAHHHRSGINPYGGTDPGEFFAVVSEYFFTDPETLRHESPAVYDQLVLFYRQDPLKRRAKPGGDRASHQR